MNSRRKGAEGEREWARVCRENGYDCHRTAQYCGKSGEAADVVGLPGVHIEVKRRERFDIYAAVDQAKRDAKPGLLPIVPYRKNNHPWLVIMPADDWFQIYREWEASRDAT